MSKKPFSIRVDENLSMRYRALASVLNIESSVLFEKLIKLQEEKLNEEQNTAYQTLLKAWGID